MKKAFFFDIDGTLVYENQGKLFVSERNIQAIKNLRKQGYKTFIATGRTQGFIPSAVLELPMDSFITANGSVVRIGDKLVYEKLFPQSAIDSVLEFCEKHNHDWLFEGEYAYVNNLESEDLSYFYDNVIVNKDKIITTHNLYNVTIYNALVLGRNVDVVALQHTLGNDYVTAPHNEHGYVDCYLAGHTKADGIDKVVEYLGLEEYETYAFGDGNNDLEMFDRVDVAIAMENASSQLKEKADLITKTNYNDGIYYALVKLGLIKS
ncbi:Cof-type HAD-IIB family hydrolase [Francisella tularensis]|uniref:Cof-type HAD-IIB family hydrolase n=1 Tax=Francisella tularensis TaxID=263 RepID=UPI001C0EC963|nr:Cof-type HAD-IIB family hydrolase [Francisella tularensis]MBK2113575.1 Cof-type HAD-IIB family hydrolase [Francisella tularensis subsp. tularensis]MBK2134266.1 Cof-type HAD-IIB family hydrolase [Francisella tularensis]MBK2135935.1 Cof-type HAD-IIB family hydrolase [Francisella tularensis]